MLPRRWWKGTNRRDSEFRPGLIWACCFLLRPQPLSLRAPRSWYFLAASADEKSTVSRQSIFLSFLLTWPFVTSVVLVVSSATSVVTSIVALMIAIAVVPAVVTFSVVRGSIVGPRELNSGIAVASSAGKIWAHESWPCRMSFLLKYLQCPIEQRWLRNQIGTPHWLPLDWVNWLTTRIAWSPL